MKKLGLILCFLFVASCTLKDEFFYQNGIFPSRPTHGFDREDLFPNRLKSNMGASENMCIMLRHRRDWNPSTIDFKSQYPSFNIELLSFNNLDPSKSFTWQERMMFADALELIVYAINHPLFEEKMGSMTFYDNDLTHIVPSAKIVKSIRNTKLTFIIAKEDLDKNVLAQATVGGFHHMIWFRSDTDYQQYSVLSLAVVLGHELTHNLGFLHASNVPYGIQDVILEVIKESSKQDVTIFKDNTPYYEDSFLQRVRDSSSRARSLSSQTLIQEDSHKDFGDLF